MKLFCSQIILLWGILMTTSCAAAPGKENKGVITIKPHNGMPAMFLDGQPEPAMFHFSQEVLDDYAQKFHKAGFKFYASIDEHAYLDLGWVGDYEFDFKVLDKVLSNFARRLPDSYIMPKVQVWAPEWWLDKHPAEAIGLDPKPEKYVYVVGADTPKHESFASELWKKEAGEGLRRMVEHIMAGPHADRVIGIMIGAGTWTEWLPWQWTPEYMIDTSEPMRQSFIRYVKQKYNNDIAQLRQAWNDPQATFDSIKIPLRQERFSNTTGLFLDPAKSRKVVDYYEAFHWTTAEKIDYFCKIVKDASKGKLMTCVNYAYPPDLPWATQMLGHRWAAQVMRLDSIDAFSSPHEYYHRDLGESGALRHFPQSLALHGKLFIDETDERTHLTTHPLFKHASTLDESLQVMWRSFANAVTHGVGMWYMDHTSREWFADDAFFVEFAKIKKWADHSMTISRKRSSEVAVFNAFQSEFYVAAQTDLSAQFNLSQIEQFCRSGAPFDRYLIEDLAEGLMPDYKVYVFLDCFYLTDKQLNAIEKLKSKGKTLVWFYAPGFVTEKGLSLKNMEDLTGISFTQEARPFSRVKIVPKQLASVQSDFAMWTTEKHFGDYLKELTPRFVPNDPNSDIWGRYADTDEPALVVKNAKDWTSIYCPTGGLPWNVLNAIYKNAGVHLYCTDGDNLTVSQRWLGLHTATGGRKHIQLPNASRVYDVINDRLIGENLTGFSVELAAKKTALYLLSPVEK